MPKYLNENGTEYLINKLQISEVEWTNVPLSSLSTANLVWTSGVVRYRVWGNVVHWNIYNLRTKDNITYEPGAMIINGIPSMTQPSTQALHYTFNSTIIQSVGRTYGGQVDVFLSTDTNNWCIVAYAPTAVNVVPTYGLFCDLMYLI